MGGGGCEGGDNGIVVEESRQRVGTAQSTGMVKWGEATLETQHFGIHNIHTCFCVIQPFCHIIVK